MKVKNNQKTWSVSLFFIFMILFIMRATDLFLIAKIDVPFKYASLIMGILVIVWLGVTYCLNYFRSAKTLGVLIFYFSFLKSGEDIRWCMNLIYIIVVQLGLAIIGFVLAIIYLKTV